MMMSPGRHPCGLTWFTPSDAKAGVSVVEGVEADASMAERAEFDAVLAELVAIPPSISPRMAKPRTTRCTLLNVYTHLSWWYSKFIFLIYKHLYVFALLHNFTFF
jgi:hypothetical protein